MTSGVYKITNTVTGKCYIGSSTNIKQRFVLHKNLFNRNKHHSKYMQRSWNKHGKDVFIFEIVYACAPIKDILLFYEQLWIDFYGFENLYNECSIAGSPLGVKHSNETKDKIRISKIDKMVPIIQINMSGEIIGRYKSISEAARMVGAGHSAIRKSIYSYHKCCNSMFIKNIDEIENALSMHFEIKKQQMELSIKNGKKIGKIHKKSVAQFNKNTLKQICIFNSCCDAGRLTKIHHSSISKCAAGKVKTAGGYIWRYVDDKELK